MHRYFHRLLLLLIALCSFGFGQVAYQLSPVAHQQFFDSNGKPLAGGFVYTYSAGSTTPLATYKDNAGTANTNPIVLDAGGFATIYLGQNSYKFCVQNSSAVQQWCQDNVQNISQVLLTTANVWSLGQTFNSLINFLGGTSDTTAAEGNVFYRTDLHRLRWYDAGCSCWHSVTGDDDTATLTNKTYDTAGAGNVFKMAGTTVSGVTGTGSGVLATSPTITTPTLTGAKVDRIIASGAAPSCAFSTGGGTSPSCTMSTNSTDASGEIVAGTGTGSPGASGTITLTFSAAYGSNGSTCNFWPENINASWNARASMIVGPRTTALSTFAWDNNAVTLTVSSLYVVGYNCWAR